jgi:uncharacterized protein YbbC (DUF1343 family)
VRLGIESLLADAPSGKAIGKRLGLLTHPAAVLPDLSLGLDVLLAAGQPVVAVFGPEHGLRGTAQAGSSEAATVDAATGLPVYDTYRNSFDAALSDSGIDVLLVDLQHVGARFYTYESSLFDAIAAAKTVGVRVVILDRPNPIGGHVVDGPVLAPAFSSFVGRAPIPLRHGMTMGELGRLFADLQGAPAPDVVPMTGWRRSDLFRDTGLPWVAPSLNLPSDTSAYLYPGTCLFEGTNVSLGRGTTTPFEVIGAPWLDGRLAAHLRTLDLPGVAFRATSFSPAFDDYTGEHLSGVAVHVRDPATVDPLRVALAMLTSIARIYPHEMTYRSSFDKLAGTDALRTAIVAGVPAAEIAAGWSSDLQAFRPQREACLLYP